MNIQELKLEKISDTLSVYQKDNVFSYGTDAVLLANFVKSCVKNLQGKHMCDLCSGTGIVPLLLCDYDKTIICDAVEINSDACEISELSAKYSGYSDRFNIHNADIKNIKEEFEAESFDFLTCNPPYMTADCGKMCIDDYKTIARHEILCNINDVFRAAFHLLRTGGSIFIVYRSDRLSSLFRAASENRFEIKRMSTVCTKPFPSVMKLVLCEAKKDGAEGLILEGLNV